MEVFKTFSVFSLVDMLSGPLKKIKEGLLGTDATTATLSQRMAKLALAMLPVAVAARAVLNSFGSCVSVAKGFEDQMAKVGAVSRASHAEMALLEATARRPGATTRFTASQVAEAEMYLAMAGFTAQQNVAALPGVLNLAAASATDLGRASDISSDILSAFGLQAAEMTRVADVLALTCATANTNVELLGDTMKYVGPVARNAGLSLEEAAAMAGLLGNVGIKGSMAGTSLKAMINKIAAPAGEAQKLLKQLGITVQDSAGNLRSPIILFGEMAKKLETMGTAQQIAALKTIVGEEAIAGFAELINQEGIGSITKYVEQLNNAGGAAEEMARRMGNTFGGSQRNLSSAWESLQISIGKLFLPVLGLVVGGVTKLIAFFDLLAQSTVGAFFIGLLSAISVVAIAVTALAAGIWAFKTFGPLLVEMFLPIKAMLAGAAWPIFLIIGAITLLYIAYKKNFGGIADILKKWWNNIRLVFKGVSEIFKVLKGNVFELRGELAKNIKAAGLEKLVLTVARIVYRIKSFFEGIWDGLNFTRVFVIMQDVSDKIGAVFGKIGSIISRIFNVEVASAGERFENFGTVIGMVAGTALSALATILNIIANALNIVVGAVEFIIALFTGDWNGACQSAIDILDSLSDALMSVADFFNIGDWLREKWSGALDYLSSLNLFESGAKILDTLKEGIMSKATALKDTVVGVFSKLRNLLPFSDAKEGPLSELTLSGSRIMTTLASGISGGVGELHAKMTSALQGISSKIGSWWDSLFDDKPAQNLIPPIQSPVPDNRDPDEPTGRSSGKQPVQNYWTINIGTIVLPNATDGNSFKESLEALVAEYGGDVEPA